MTSQQRFESELPGLLTDLYVGGLPDYRDDLLRSTAATRQRPAWSFPTRWLPMDLTMRRVPALPVPWRVILLALLILTLIATALFVGAGQHRVPPPFGPARTGPIAYGRADAIYTRTSVDAPEHVLVGGAGRKLGFSGFSPDGTKLLFVETLGDESYLMAAEADGSNQRRILATPVRDLYAAWAPDGQTVAISDDTDRGRRVMLLHLDGSPVTTVDLGGASPTDLAWRPPAGAELLVRASSSDGSVDLYRVRADGTTIGALHVFDPQVFGVDWDVSGPAWSPSGDRIAYNQVEGDPGHADQGRFRVHLMNADGTGDVAVPPPDDQNVNEAWPVWSPDGRSIAVQRFIFGDPEVGWLAVIPADRSGPGRDVLARLRGAGGIVKTWSPDGARLLAYTKDTGETYSIDPVSGRAQKMDWPAADLADFQRLAE